MRILLSSYGSRGDVEPLAGLAAALQALGVEAIASAPPDREFTDLLARAGAAMAPAFMSARAWIEAAKARPTDGIRDHAARMIGAQFEAIGAAAAGCDAIVATGLMPSAAAAKGVAETLGVPYFHATFCPLFLPSEHHRPFPYPGRPHPPEVTDPRTLWDLNVGDMNALFGEAVNGWRATIGLPLVDNVRDHVFTDRPLLASDPILWPWAPTALCDAVQTGAWILPDARPLPGGLEAFLSVGEPPIYVGFGSIALPTTRDAAQVALRVARSMGRRVVLARGWVEATPLDDGDDCFLVGDVNQQALFQRVAAAVHHGGAGTTTAAARAGAPQVIVPQIVDQPYWARRVADLGAGLAHDGATPSEASLATVLDAALRPDVRKRASEVARLMPGDGAERGARWLIQAVRGSAS